MFKRIKNLLDISRYTVEELKSIKYYQSTTSGYVEVLPPVVSPKQTMTLSGSSTGMATIINMQTEDPFKNFDNETPEQSPDDTTARN
jgi:hypothetical protein